MKKTNIFRSFKNKYFSRRQFIKSSGVAVAGLGIIPFISRCEDEPVPDTGDTEEESVFLAPETFDIAIFSDIHRGVNDSGPLANPDTALITGVDYVNSRTSQPDFVAVTGDLILGREAITCTEEQEIEALHQFKDYLDENLTVPYHLAHGNHDSPHWEEVMGDKHYSFEHKNVNFIVTAIDYIDDLRDGGAGNYTQDDFLRNTLEEHKNQLNIIFIHNPLYPSTLIAESSDHVTKILQEEYSSTPIIVVQGHLHYRMDNLCDNTLYIVTTRQDTVNYHDFYWMYFTENEVSFYVVSQEGTGSYDGQQQRSFIAYDLSKYKTSSANQSVIIS